MKISTLFLMMFMLVITATITAKEYHVAVNGSDSGVGSRSVPFKTIMQAVKVAFPGDTITVHAGIYREWINPLRGGESDSKRIVYRAAPGEKVEIKGSEIVKGWVKEKEGVWKVVIPNSFFGSYNPYRDSINGDWFYRMGRIHHTGEVFLNGRSFYEKETKGKVIKANLSKEKNPHDSTYTWYCENNADNTTIWANFQQFNPNRELVEISTRRTCIYPEKPGINYITISGFHISQAATQWAAPTAEQVGMVATHWNKGWIIENNVISDSKCNGITLGKERGTGHNVWTADAGNVNNDGNIHYIEVTFRVLRNGWNKENIGSHIVRNNEIFKCEQTGICGSMGAAFSTIENNHIYNIWTKRQFNGAEIAGIKFHAAIDAILNKNRIHNCGRGLWLDWMSQGVRVSGNLFYGNDLEDLFMEVNHGPLLVDNNIFLSPKAIRNQSEGNAFVNNLIAGGIYMWPDPNRFTPYFMSHSTDIAGLTTIFSGDDRFYNNIFIGNGEIVQPDSRYQYGLAGYAKARLPVWISNNIYYNGAKPYGKEEGSTESLYNPGFRLVDEGENVFLHFTFDEAYFKQKGINITTEFLGKAKIPKGGFENPDGTSLIINKDYSGNARSDGNITEGPFSDLKPGSTVLKVW